MHAKSSSSHNKYKRLVILGLGLFGLLILGGIIAIILIAHKAFAPEPSATAFNKFELSHITQLSSRTKTQVDSWFNTHGFNLQSAQAVSNVSLCYQQSNYHGIGVTSYSKSCYYRETAVFSSTQDTQVYVDGFKATTLGNTASTYSNLPCYTAMDDGGIDYIIASPDTLLTNQAACSLEFNGRSRVMRPLDLYQNMGPHDDQAFYTVNPPFVHAQYLQKNTYSFGKLLAQLKTNGIKTVLIIGNSDPYYNQVIH